ncbi:MAG: phage holin, LLH family [Sarcina sp.]
METNQILSDLYQFIVLPILPVIGLLLAIFIRKGIDYLQTKIDNDYVNMQIDKIEDITVKAVLIVQQVYTEELKKQGKFDVEAQKLAVRMAIEKVDEMLDEDGKKFLESIYGDYTKYLEYLIESIIAKSK